MTVMPIMDLSAAAVCRHRGQHVRIRAYVFRTWIDVKHCLHPPKLALAIFAQTTFADPSLADMESRPFTCHCYWHEGGHCADWVENGWICPSLAKHSEEGGQCYCNPYNPFPFKNKHCRQAWVDRGWMCPWTPGNPIPASTTNNAMER